MAKSKNEKDKKNEKDSTMEKIPSQLPLDTEFGAGKTTKIETMPIIYLDEKRSFWSDILSMAKLTRTISKKK